MRIAVYGLGNVLRRDDGFGPSAVRRLDARYEFDGDVVLRDLGAPGLDLASHLVGFDAVVFLDVLRGGGPPGTVRVLGRDDILTGGAAPPRVTGHDLDLRDALHVADLAGGAPRHVHLVGVVPGDLGTGPGLTRDVEAAVGPACERVLAELAELGARPRPRRDAPPTGAWWERAGSVD